MTCKLSLNASALHSGDCYNLQFWSQTLTFSQAKPITTCTESALHLDEVSPPFCAFPSECSHHPLKFGAHFKSHLPHDHIVKSQFFCSLILCCLDMRVCGPFPQLDFKLLYGRNIVLYKASYLSTAKYIDCTLYKQVLYIGLLNNTEPFKMFLNTYTCQTKVF